MANKGGTEFWSMAGTASVALGHLGATTLKSGFETLVHFGNREPVVKQPAPLAKNEQAVAIIEEAIAEDDSKLKEMGKSVLEHAFWPPPSYGPHIQEPSDGTIRTVAASAYEHDVAPEQFVTDDATKDRLASAMGELAASGRLAEPAE